MKLYMIVFLMVLFGCSHFSKNRTTSSDGYVLKMYCYVNDIPLAKDLNSGITSYTIEFDSCFYQNDDKNWKSIKSIKKQSLEIDLTTYLAMKLMTKNESEKIYEVSLEAKSNDRLVSFYIIYIDDSYIPELGLDKDNNFELASEEDEKAIKKEFKL